MATTNDLEKRAKELRDKLLTKEDKTNLVAKAIIELVKENKKLITYTEVCNQIQHYLGLECKKEQYIICASRFVRKNITNDFKIATFLAIIIGICLEKNLISISIVVIDVNGNFQLDGFKGGYKVNGAEYNGNVKKDQKETLKKIINGEYDFLLKPIPILDKIKIEKSIDEDIKNIEEAINHNNDIQEKDKKDTTEIAIELRIPLGKMKDDVLKRANGECEYCKNKEMTFEKEDGEKYFEIHHIKHYSVCKKEGIYPHTLNNLAALCPRCHKKIHFGKKDDIAEMEKTLKEKIKNN